MAFTSELGTSDSLLGFTMQFGGPPPFGNQVIVTAFNSVIISQSDTRSTILANYDGNTHLSFSQRTSRDYIPALRLIDRFLLEAVTIDVYDDIVATDRSIVRYLKRQDPGDFPPGGQPLNEVQVIDEFSGPAPTGGTWDLIFTLLDGSVVPVTIPYNTSTIPAIQALVDAALDGQIPGYAAGDIVISSVLGITNDIKLSFTGNSVRYTRYPLVQTDTSNLIGTAGTFGPVTELVAGHPARYGWSILYVLGVVKDLPSFVMGDLPPAGYFNVNPQGSRADYPPQWVIRGLAEEMAYVEDNIELKLALYRALGIRA